MAEPLSPSIDLSADASAEIIAGALPHPAIEERYLAPLFKRVAWVPYRPGLEEAFRLGWRLRHQLELNRQGGSADARA